MPTADSSTPRFEVQDTAVDIDTLVVGFTEYGLAGLTAVDYLSDQLDMREAGHLVTAGPPSITPFESGVPRHHTRLYVDGARSLAVVVGERMVPVGAAEETAAALSALAERLAPESLTALTGVPVAHGPDDHVPFYIATEDYRDRYLDDTDIRPMGNGFLDGVTAELVADGIGDDERPVGVFTTPAHPQAPDAAAAIRLLDALTATHDIDVDTGPLESFAATVEAQYRALAERIESADERAMPDDRMYM
ncbi:proteasome assembly chaperone family protein [Haloarcula onubensis]|uniref:PAC2 family protein n=1 Tax=Haloarcula onubensis TaxID=2950539 RepID=A0ABU2FTS8_9EURY|nr:PAC2 family protein [Halomicroarcula sp. S3CR25-11]MDS0284150.1 PAC2 family protein [Halomicroarcula sp. S3CR25-11]